jgi:predicted  nucleic acid-binding Zn-ribbon protein
VSRKAGKEKADKARADIAQRIGSLAWQLAVRHLADEREQLKEERAELAEQWAKVQKENKALRLCAEELKKRLDSVGADPLNTIARLEDEVAMARAELAGARAKFAELAPYLEPAKAAE